MTLEFRREFAHHSITGMFFLLGLIAADRIMGDRSIDPVELADSGVVVQHQEHPPALSSSTERVFAAKPYLRPVSFRTVSNLVRPTNNFEADSKLALVSSGTLEPATLATSTVSSTQQSNAGVAEPVSLQDEGHADTADSPTSKLDRVREIEEARIATVQKISPAVVCIFGLERQGGGSGVLIHPNGLALTNHHVVAACGVEGWGGLSDGKLYRWRLVGNDPGGDLALIQLQGMDEFPFVRMGDSDQVQVGDWTLVMGNPFTLADDYTPTVTHGIVSGVHRYQPGMADVMLVYGDCIQTDTSINPGNSGGPLFDMQGNLIGINGRASFDFQTRGRVNVGLGYAISVNQCRNFLPELMATKLVQHGTLDAVFQDRDGKVTCIAMYEDSEVGKLGMALGDELLEFESKPIHSSNQFTNLICTLPAGWPVHLKMRRPDGTEYEIASRLLGLPYPKTAQAAVKPKKQQPDGDERLPEEDPDENEDGMLPPDSDESPDESKPEEQESILGRQDQLRQEIAKSKKELNQFLSGKPGVAQYDEVQQKMGQLWLDRWAQNRETSAPANQVKLAEQKVWQITEAIEHSDGAKLELRIQFDPAQDLWALQTAWKEVDQPNIPDYGEGWEVHFRHANDQWQSLEPNDAGDGEWQTVGQAKLMESTFGAQLVWIRQHIMAGQSMPLGEWKLAGAGKAAQQLAVRLQHQSDEGQYWIWLRLDDWTKPSQVQLLRSAEDEDGRYGLGSTLYDRWQQTDAGLWPVERRIAFGLLQEIRAKIVTQTIEQVQPDAKLMGQ